ncbi:MAG TPA: glycosyltransferase [Chloroflexi bacterium]|nr:glycosyltransferase [Chloroflexota bacterium]
MKATCIGPFGLRIKGTTRARLLPLARALVRKGWSAVAILPPWDSPQDSGKTWEDNGVVLRHIRLPVKAPLLYHLLVAWRLVRECLSHKPELVHLFKPIGYPGLTAMMLWSLKRLGRFRGLLIVDADDWEGHGGWSDISAYPAHWRAFIPFQERWVLTHCDAVTVASRTLQTLVWSLGVPPSKVFYLPNGVELRGGSPQGSQLPGVLSGKATVVLYTRFVEFAPERLWRIWKEVVSQVPEAHLVVIGRGFKGEESSLLEMAREDGLGSTLSCLGWKERDEALRLLEEAKVAIWPSDDNLINRAKCSAKLAELASLGIPVVAEDVGENSLYVPAELLVKSGDVSEFARKVAALLRDEAFRLEMGRKTRERVIPELTWDNLAEGFVKFISCYAG